MFRGAGTCGACLLDVVRLVVTLHDVGKASEEIARALRSVARAARLERGCEECGVWSDTVQDTVRYDEAWVDEGALRRRVRSQRFTQLLEIMEAASRPPDVSIECVAEPSGLVYIANVRQTLDGSDESA